MSEMNSTVALAFFKALAGIKGQVDGRALRAGAPCDLSGLVKGRITATDVIDQLQADVSLDVAEENKAEILQSYVESYNRVLNSGVPS
jgi:hypothetical protein